MATKQSSKPKSSKSSKSSSRSTAGGSRKPASSRSGQAPKSSSRAPSGTSRAGARKTAAKRPSRPGAARTPPRSASGSRKASGTSRGRTGTVDALKLLREDHDNVSQMFKRYDRMKEGDERKQALRETILEELRVHAQVEEELFYPALKSLFEQAQKDKAVELIDEADVEHETVKWLIEQLEDQSDEAMTDARVKVLGEYVSHHVKEEEGEIFKAAKKVDLDLVELGQRMDARKRQLKGEAPEGSRGGGTSMQIDEPAQMASGLTEP